MTSQLDSPHPLNRHMVIADNLELLRAMDNETVDLIVTDPPFAKNYAFTGKLKPPLSAEELALEKQTLAGWGIHNRAAADKANIEWPDNGDATARFSDIWTWEKDIHEEWLDKIEAQHRAAAKVIDAARYSHSDGHAAYLSYMAIRLVEMRRVLKPTGSMFLHCDPTANSYLRLVFDAVFGANNFRNEIVWSYRTGGASRTSFSKKHDTIFFYSKSNEWTYNKPKEKSYTKSKSRKPGVVNYGGGQAEFFQDEDGVYNWVNMRDVWNIPYIGSTDPERTGYPTQKPAALAECIIRASSHPGDVVLDPFAGCAYVPVAAERLGRQWIACDINPRAMTVVRRQFNKFHYAVDGRSPDLEMEEGRQAALIADADIRIIRPDGIPERATRDPAPAAVMRPRERRYKVPASDIPAREMLVMLLELSGYQAWCCGFANRRPDGAVIRRPVNFHLDHIDPRSAEGSNRLPNRAPLCPYHNQQKRDRRIPLDEFRREIIAAGELQVPEGDLIDLTWAREKTLDLYLDRAGGRRASPLRREEPV